MKDSKELAERYLDAYLKDKGGTYNDGIKAVAALIDQDRAEAVDEAADRACVYVKESISDFDGSTYEPEELRAAVKGAK